MTVGDTVSGFGTAIGANATRAAVVMAAGRASREFSRVGTGTCETSVPGPEPIVQQVEL